MNRRRTDAIRLLFVIGLVISFFIPAAHAADTAFPIEAANRVDQAKQLLGPKYKKSSVHVTEDVADMNPYIREWAKDHMPTKFKKQSNVLAQAVIDAGRDHAFDPVFLMAVIQSESSFDPTKKGSVGEIGLMQMRPETAEWLAKKFHMEWTGAKSLRDIATNIRFGATYLAYLRDRFDSHARLYLSAYNMGAKNVDDLRSNHRWPKDYVVRVMTNYVEYYSGLKIRLDASPDVQTIAAID